MATCDVRVPESVAIPAIVAALAAVRDLADAVREQGHLAGHADGPGHLSLLLGVVAGDTAGADLRPLGHEAPQHVHVLVVDVDDLLAVEDRDALLGLALDAVVAAPRAGSCHGGDLLLDVEGGGEA